jgi:hypothetical protein
MLHREPIKELEGVQPFLDFVREIQRLLRLALSLRKRVIADRKIAGCTRK